MTICPTCHNGIQGLACPVCMRGKYLRDLEQSELKLLPHVVNGGQPMKLLKTGRRQPPHIGYQEGFRKEAYCQVELHSPRLDYYAFRDRPKLLCRNCVSTLKTYLQRAGLDFYAGQLK